MLKEIYDRLVGRWGVRAFVIVPGLVYVGALLGMTLAFAGDLPVEGWIGLGVALAVVTVLAALTIGGLERTVGSAGKEHASHRASSQAARRLLVIADASCLDASVCQRLVDRVQVPPEEALVITPLLPSPIHYLFGRDVGLRVAQEGSLAIGRGHQADVHRQHDYRFRGPGAR